MLVWVDGVPECGLPGRTVELQAFSYDEHEFPILAAQIDRYDGHLCTRLTMAHDAAHVAGFIFDVINIDFHPSFAGCEPEATVWVKEW